MCIRDRHYNSPPSLVSRTPLLTICKCRLPMGGIMSQEWEQPVLQVHREPLPLGACTMSTKISSTRSGEHSSTRMTAPRGITPTQGISRCMPMGEVDHSIRAVLLLSHTTSTTSLTISQQLCGVNSHMHSSTTRF